MQGSFARIAAVGLLLLLGSCATAEVIGDARLIDSYSPERQEKLFREPLPFLAHYEFRNRHLGIVAVVHSSDPRSPTFRIIEQAFRTIRPRAVILEGFPTSWGASPARVMSKLEIIDPADSYARGEDMHAARLAHQNGVEVWGGEPDEREIAAELRRLGFHDRDVFFASMFGPLAQDREAKLFENVDDPRLAAAYAKWADVNARAYDPTAPRDLASFEAWFVGNYGRGLRDDPEWFTRGGPGQQGVAGEIGRASNRIRDQHMFALALRLMNGKGRVLVVAGGSHLSSQWRAFEAALGTPRIVSPLG